MLFYIIYDNNIYNELYVDPIDLTTINSNLSNIDYKNNIYLVLTNLYLHLILLLLIKLIN